MLRTCVRRGMGARNMRWYRTIVDNATYMKFRLVYRSLIVGVTHHQEAIGFWRSSQLRAYIKKIRWGWHWWHSEIYRGTDFRWERRVRIFLRSGREASKFNQEHRTKWICIEQKIQASWIFQSTSSTSKDKTSGRLTKFSDRARKEILHKSLVRNVTCNLQTCRRVSKQLWSFFQGTKASRC